MAGAFFDDVSAQDLLDVEALGRVEMMRAGGPHCTSLRLAIQKMPHFFAGALGAPRCDERGRLLASDNFVEPDASRRIEHDSRRAPA